MCNIDIAEEIWECQMLQGINKRVPFHVIFCRNRDKSGNMLVLVCFKVGRGLKRDKQGRGELKKNAVSPGNPNVKNRFQNLSLERGLCNSV